MEENLNSFDFNLDADDMAAIKALIQIHLCSLITETQLWLDVFYDWIAERGI